MEIIAQGAEAIIKKADGKVIKQRLSKRWRHPQIDSQITAQRTRREAKIIKKLSDIGFPSPRLLQLDEEGLAIHMEYLDGEKLADVLERDDVRIGQEIGKKLALLHAAGIIHGDPTTSNMIRTDHIHFIDFGLSFVSDKVEHKAVDLRLLERSLESKHHTIAKRCFGAVLSAYQQHGQDASAVLDRLEKVKARGRYKNQNQLSCEVRTKNEQS